MRNFLATGPVTERFLWFCCWSYRIGLPDRASGPSYAPCRGGGKYILIPMLPRPQSQTALSLSHQPFLISSPPD